MSERRLPSGAEEMVALVLSNAHLTEETAQDLMAHGFPALVVGLSWDYGWIIHISQHETFEGMPEDLARCMKFAKDNGYDWLRFDGDGPQIEELPAFSW